MTAISKKCILSIVLLISILAVPSASAAACDTEAVFYPFNSSSATDYSGCNNDGMKNGDITTGVSGFIGDAWSFDGQDDDVNTTVFDYNQSGFTMVAWVKHDNPGNGNYEMIWGSDDGSNGFSMGKRGNSNGDFQCALRDGGGSAVTAINDNAVSSSYEFLACRYNGSAIQLYRNGTFENSKSATTHNKADDAIFVGDNGVGYKQEWSGDIDQPRFYNKALSKSELDSLYNNHENPLTGGDSNSPPTASLSLNATNVDPGETFLADANGSDIDGTISSIEYDWTSDGTYDASGDTATHSYSSNGTYTVTARVTDDDGANDTASEKIQVGEVSGGSPIFDGCVLYLNFNSTSSSTATNWCNSGNDAQLGSNVNIASLDPVDGKYADLPGDSLSSVINVSDYPGLDVGSSETYTFTSKVRVDTGPSHAVALSKAVYGGSRNYQLDYFDDSGEGVSGNFTWYDSASGNTRFNEKGEIGVWKQVSWIYEGSSSQVELWVNGTYVGTVSVSDISTNNGKLYIGTDTYGNYLSGDIDEVSIYDRRLTSKEINRLHNNDVTPPPDVSLEDYSDGVSTQDNPLLFNSSFTFFDTATKLSLYTNLTEDLQYSNVDQASRIGDGLLIHDDVVSTYGDQYIGGGQPEYFPEKDRDRVYYFFSPEYRADTSGGADDKKIGFGYAPTSNPDDFQESNCNYIMHPDDVPWSSNNKTSYPEIVKNPNTGRYHMYFLVDNTKLAMAYTDGNFCNWTLGSVSQSGPLLSPAAGQTIIRDDENNRFMMLYEDDPRTSAARATIPYSNMSDINVVQSDVGFQSGYEGEAGLYRDPDGTYNVFYNSGNEILHYTTEDWNSYTANPDNPIFTPSSSGWDDLNVQTFDVLETPINNRYLFTYAGQNDTSKSYYDVGLGEFGKADWGVSSQKTTGFNNGSTNTNSLEWLDVNRPTTIKWGLRGVQSDGQSDFEGNRTLTLSEYIEDNSPSVTIYSPQNQTYSSSEVDLNVTSSEPADSWKYNLDGSGNTTFTPNTTLDNLSGGNHDLTVWAEFPNSTAKEPVSFEVFTTDNEKNIIDQDCSNGFCYTTNSQYNTSNPVSVSGSFYEGQSRSLKWEVNATEPGSYDFFGFYNSTVSRLDERFTEIISLSVESNDTGTSNSAPTADFTTSLNELSVSTDGSSSSDSDGSISSYEWDWASDGTYESSGQTSSHTYPSEGEYTITLRVTDDDGATDTTSKTVSMVNDTDDGDSGGGGSDGGDSGGDNETDDGSSISVDGTNATLYAPKSGMRYTGNLLEIKENNSKTIIADGVERQITVENIINQTHAEILIDQQNLTTYREKEEFTLVSGPGITTLLEEVDVRDVVKLNDTGYVYFTLKSGSPARSPLVFDYQVNDSATFTAQYRKAGPENNWLNVGSVSESSSVEYSFQNFNTSEIKAGVYEARIKVETDDNTNYTDSTGFYIGEVPAIEIIQPFNDQTISKPPNGEQYDVPLDYKFEVPESNNVTGIGQYYIDSNNDRYSSISDKNITTLEQNSWAENLAEVFGWSFDEAYGAFSWLLPQEPDLYYINSTMQVPDYDTYNGYVNASIQTSTGELTDLNSLPVTVNLIETSVSNKSYQDDRLSEVIDEGDDPEDVSSPHINESFNETIDLDGDNESDGTLNSPYFWPIEPLNAETLTVKRFGEAEVEFSFDMGYQGNLSVNKSIVLKDSNNKTTRINLSKATSQYNDITVNTSQLSTDSWDSNTYTWYGEFTANGATVYSTENKVNGSSTFKLQEAGALTLASRWIQPVVEGITTVYNVTSDYAEFFVAGFVTVGWYGLFKARKQDFIAKAGGFLWFVGFWWYGAIPQNIQVITIGLASLVAVIKFWRGEVTL